MAAVYVSNLVINTGSTFSQTFNLESTETNSAMDLTGYTPTSQMRKWAGASTAVDFTATIPDPKTAGKVTISLTATQTAALKAGRHVYNILITGDGVSAPNTTDSVVEGMVLVREGVTR